MNGMHKFILGVLVVWSILITLVIWTMPAPGKREAPPTHRAWPADKPLPLTYGEILENDRQPDDGKSP